MKVEIAYALPERQTLLTVDVDPGTTVAEAIRASGIIDLHPEIDLEDINVGVFSNPTRLDAELVRGDRVEIYRPLRADPKEVRRRLAAEGKSIGSGIGREAGAEADED